MAQPGRERPGTGRQRASLAEAPLSAEVVAAARTLYLAAVANAVRRARRAKRWPEVARIRRQQAAALFWRPVPRSRRPPRSSNPSATACSPSCARSRRPTPMPSW